MASEPDEERTLKIRPAEPADAAEIARLSGELGYPASAQQIETRMQALISRPDHAIWIAELAEGQIVGWVHVCVRPLVMVNWLAEVEGLVVDSKQRGLGIGSQLMAHAEAWAQSQGCTTLYLRSNTLRKDAHRFYERLGYANIKTQKAFRKDL